MTQMQKPRTAISFAMLFVLGAACPATCGPVTTCPQIPDGGGEDPAGSVPRIGQGDVSCAPGAADCSVCAPGLVAQITEDPHLNIGKPNGSFEIRRTGSFPIDTHNQGIARLRDSEGRQRLVLSDNGSSSGLRLATSATSKFTDIVEFPVRGVDAYGDHDHPGGMQAHGDLIAVAMEGGPQSAAVYFLRATGASIELVQTMALDGSHGEPDGVQKSATSAGFVKLGDGRYLLAVSGSGQGTEGIRFYKSETPEISDSTRWRFVDFYKPICQGFGGVGDNCWAGAAGGMNLVTDCRGGIYLLVMTGTDTSPGREYEYLQVFRVGQDLAGKILLTKVAQQEEALGLIATNNVSFRWAGGAFVSPEGVLALLSTERRTNDNGNNDYVSGSVYLGVLKPGR